jgi:hypothetical protein
MTTNHNNPALVAWVAEHVMGWKCYHHRDHSVQNIDDICIEGGYAAIVEYSLEGEVLSVVPFDAEFGVLAAWTPLTDANADLMVLRKVREEWRPQDAEDVDDKLYEIWDDRHYTTTPWATDPSGRKMCRWGWFHLQYQCGDFTQAAAKAKGYHQ